MTDRSTYCDVKADHDRNEYHVVERATGKVIATYKYKAHSENSRGIAAGKANMHRLEINRKININPS